MSIRVPKEAKQKEEEPNAGNVANAMKEFFPAVHNFLRLRFLLSPSEPEKLHRQNAWPMFDSKS